MKTIVTREKSKITNPKGITLIALVVTIIVLLILAGISIQMLIGQNGILNRAEEAKEKTESASVEEQKLMAMLEAAANFENTTYKGVTIPAGFAPTKIEGENTIADGLVIIDSEGNEFVWIKVPKTEEIYKKTHIGATEFVDETYKNIEDDLQEYINDYRMDIVKDEWVEKCALDKDEYNRLKMEMLKSIYVNEGFWVGRYETGYEGAIRNKQEDDWKKDIEKKPVVKEGAYPFNYLNCFQAQKLATKINYKEYEGSVMFRFTMGIGLQVHRS